MPAFLIPILTGFGTALSALLIRYIEKKILKLDANTAAAEIQNAREVAKNPQTIQHLEAAADSLKNLKANLNGSFAKKR